MSLPSFAAPSDLALDESVEARLAQSVLDRVSTAVRATTGQTWVDDEGALVTMSAYVADLLRTVTVEASLRRLRNPDGATQRSAGIGPFTDSVTVEAENVYFTKLERDMLAEAVTQQFPSDGGFVGLGTIATTRGPLETAPAYESELVTLGDPDVIGWA